MSLLLVVLVAALVLGRLLGGSLARLGAVRLEGSLLVVIAVAAQLLGGGLGGAAYPVGVAVSAVLAAAFLLMNRRRGTGLIALGLALNALVVGLNGAMPVSAAAADRLGVDLAVLVGPQDRRHEPMTQQTRLSLLGDVVPVALPVRPEVVSIGDVLLAAGAGQLVVLGMMSGPGRSVPVLKPDREGAAMAKRGRKRRARKKNAANHGKRPNA